MTVRSAALFACLAVAVGLSVVVAGFAAGIGVVGANHGAGDVDYSVEPMDDRTPGAAGVRYGQIVVGQADTDYRTVESLKVVYEEGSWDGCGPSHSEVFGIDRGNTHDGYEVDEDLQDNTRTFSAGEDVFEIEFYGEEDFGATTHVDDGDAIVSVARCLDNPEEPGWYQISGSTTGVTESGERRRVSGESHYFWICDCEDEREAREELGPPPSEPEPTAAPEETATDGDGGTADGGSNDGSAEDGDSDADTPSDDDSADGDPENEDASTPRAGDDTATPEPTATFEPAGETGATRTPESAASGDRTSSWEHHRVQTPTPGDGDGFGGLLALGALAGAVALCYRRG